MHAKNKVFFIFIDFKFVSFSVLFKGDDVRLSETAIIFKAKLKEMRSE